MGGGGLDKLAWVVEAFTSRSRGRALEGADETTVDRTIFYFIMSKHMQFREFK